MKKKLLILLVMPLQLLAHPGIGIVADSKGNIYYTDLQQVWKISGGKRTVAVPHVHTHELYIDNRDNLYGEHVSGGSDYASTWYHYMWRLNADGKLDTIVKEKQAYMLVDFSLARDRDGNEYYTKQFIKNRDTNHIYKKYADGREVVLARGNFDRIAWLHPQKDGSVLFVMKNTIFRIDSYGNLDTVASGVATGTSSLEFVKNSKTVWGLWQDDSKNIYAAVFSDQLVKKYAPDGTVSIVHRSGGNWMPLQGVFDGEGRLWLMETSDRNEIRVVEAGLSGPAMQRNIPGFPIILLIPIIVVPFLVFIWIKKARSARLA